MAQEKEMENIVSRLRNAGVELGEKEQAGISNKYNLLVGTWHVPAAEAVRTLVTAELKARGIETKYWQSGGPAPLVTVDQIKADNEWLSLKAKVVQIWGNRSDKVHVTGLIGDGTGIVKFTVFAKNSDLVPEGFAEGNTYLFENFVSSVWQGQFSVKGNRNSEISPLADAIEVSRKAETLTGVITAVSSGSGLIKRCPECNRALVKGSCGEHGKVEGIYDLRVKAVFSPFGGNEHIDLVIGTEPTEALTGVSVEKAKEMAFEAMDTLVVADMMKKNIVGRYYEVTGGMMSDDSMLVESIKPVHICSAKALVEALSEIKGGN